MSNKANTAQNNDNSSNSSSGDDELISIIMPVYNTALYLTAAVESILNQNYKNFELIIIDDGSTDSSFRIAHEYAAGDDRVRVFRQENAGPSKARNMGLEKSRGDWIYFMDSDDTIDPDMLEKLMKNGAACDMVVSGFYKHFDGQRVSAAFMPNPAELRDQEQCCDYLKTLCCGEEQDVILNFLWNKLIRASVIRQNNIHFEEHVRLGEDFLFNCKVMQCTPRIKIIPVACYHYNIRDKSSLIGQFDVNEIQRRRMVFEALTDLYRRYGIYEECKDILQLREGRYSYMSLVKINYPTCVLTKREKEKYVECFLRDKRKKYMMAYLRQQAGIKSLMKRAIISTGNKKLVCNMILVFGAR